MERGQPCLRRKSETRDRIDGWLPVKGIFAVKISRFSLWLPGDNLNMTHDPELRSFVSIRWSKSKTIDVTFEHFLLVYTINTMILLLRFCYETLCKGWLVWAMGTVSVPFREQDDWSFGVVLAFFIIDKNPTFFLTWLGYSTYSGQYIHLIFFDILFKENTLSFFHHHFIFPRTTCKVKVIPKLFSPLPQP